MISVALTGKGVIRIAERRIDMHAPHRACPRSVVARTVAMTFLLLTALPATGAAFDEPEGFGKATLGMQEGALRAAYPRAAAEPAPATGQSGERPGFPFQSYHLEHQTVGRLTDCRIEFRLYEKELYDIQFQCSKNDKQAVADYLQARFGLPTTTSAEALFWTGKKTGVSLAVKSGVFSFHDIARGQAAQLTLIRAMAGSRRTPATTLPPGPPGQ